MFAAEEAANLALTAQLVATAKLTREETRSSHGRTDFPEADPNWIKHVCLFREDSGEVGVTTTPVIGSVGETEVRLSLEVA